MVRTVDRFEVWLATLDPARGSEIRKTRPCLVISPNEMNAWLRTIIIAPMTTAVRVWPSRVPVSFAGKDGQIALDQIRTIDRERLVKRLGTIGDGTQRAVAGCLVAMFAL